MPPIQEPPYLQSLRGENIDDVLKTFLPDVLPILGVSATQQKLKRAMATALVGGNPVVNPPWLLPPDYANNMAVLLGQVISTATGWYVCGVAGTTAATGTGPSDTGDAQFVTDGTAKFSYYGPATITENDSLGPAVSSVTSNPGGQIYRPLIYPGMYRVLGATPSQYLTNYWQLSSFDELGGVPQERGATIAWQSDAVILYVFVPSNTQGIRVSVDGRYLQIGDYNFAGVDTWLKIDWSGTTGRRMRGYEFENGKSGFYFGGVQTANVYDQVFPQTYVDDICCVALGDSIIPGGGGSASGPFLGGGSMCSLMGKLLGWRNMWNLSTGGTGYLASNNGQDYTYIQRLPQALALNPDVLMVGGSTNDVAFSSLDISNAVTRFLITARESYSGLIIVFGVPSVNSGAAAIEATVKAAVTAFDDPFVLFIPICGAATPWVTGTWNNASLPANTANSSFLINSVVDSIHPPEFGTLHYANRANSAIRNALAVP